MRTIQTLLGSAIIGLLLTNCGSKDDNPLCPDNQIWIYNDCHLKESVHEIGGTRLIANNSYVGIITSGICLDTVIFVDDTSRVDDFNRFALYVDDQHGILNVAGSYPYKVAENEYHFSSSAPLCYINGVGQYANMYAILYEPDSVRMKLRFWTLYSEPGVFTDSTELTFYKKE